MASRFFWIGNHVGIDFLNTEARDGEGERLELVGTLDALVAWAQAAQLVESDVADACRSLGNGAATRLLTWAHTLRARARAMLLPDADRPGDTEAAFNDSLLGVPVRLAYPPFGPFGAPLSTAIPADRLRLALALAVVDATTLDRSRIRRCDGELCVLVYYDTSKNGSRRWCDMAACGNRAKAAAHYLRTKR
jgi:predicted RNA-binding Zn ribbon-like protein